MIGLEGSASNGSCGINSNSNTIGSSFNLVSLRANPNPSSTSMDDESANFGSITDFHMEKLIGILEDAIQIVDEVFIDVCTAAPSGTTASTVSSGEPGVGEEAEAEIEEESTTATMNPSGIETSSHVQEHSAQRKDS
jgi:hypothetical protein